MKTMIDVTDGLLVDAKEHAEREGVTLSALVEQGLRLVLDGQRRAPPGFKLRDASVNGRGLQAEVQGKSWDEIRAMTYDARSAQLQVSCRSVHLNRARLFHTNARFERRPQRDSARAD